MLGSQTLIQQKHRRSLRAQDEQASEHMLELICANLKDNSFSSKLKPHTNHFCTVTKNIFSGRHTSEHIFMSKQFLAPHCSPFHHNSSLTQNLHFIFGEKKRKKRRRNAQCNPPKKAIWKTKVSSSS